RPADRRLRRNYGEVHRLIARIAKTAKIAKTGGRPINSGNAGNRVNFPTPRSLGYRMPAEWETHASTWIGWPQNRTDRPGKFEAIPWVYADIVRYLALDEDVNIIVRDAKARSKAREFLSRGHADLKRVKFHLWPTNRGWTRDSGPIFVKGANNSVAATDWR